ncbi:alpha-1,4-digalacturonate transport system permease protein [Crossiella equi]|uniref:Alpha-1,4-digalacturonate transport system permease protein n=1 Tax=Crossiella equi TaxID=130796 RepID=A0ABS5AFA2_9PSEU|nr:carbohydrate ABC transporter permease [Crossiella equi]MBP2475261.1 alpha-1,4-digalacturonate transport system permease protein [Crossiella equi]
MTRPRWTGVGGAVVPSLGRLAGYTLLVSLALLVLAPVVWTVLSSFKTPAELALRPPRLLPAEFAATNYVDALGRFNFLLYLRNSVLVTVAATLLTLVVNVLAAYALAKYNFRGRTTVFLVILGTVMVPIQVIFIPVYQVVSDLGLVNSLWGLIIPAAATPTGVFLLRQYLLTIPDELIEAARIDGAGELRIFLRIVLPLCRPALAVVAIFSVVWRWNDFLWPLVVAQDEQTYTLQVALARFAGEEVVPFNLILAMSVVTMAPVLVVFLVVQRQIVQGVAVTGFK